MNSNESNTGLYDTNLSKYPGRTGTVEFSGLIVAIKVIDARFRYGHIDLKVSPISGHGVRWMEIGKVTLI